MRKSCQELGYTFLLGLPRAYPNTTKQLVPVCYPLPASVKVVDDKLDFSPAGLGFRRRGGPERRDATTSKGVPYHVCTSVLWVLDGKDSTPGCDLLHRHPLLSSEFHDL